MAKHRVRRRFQFRILDLLVITTAVAVGVAIWRWTTPEPVVKTPRTFAEASAPVVSPAYDDPQFSYVLTAVHGKEDQGWHMGGATNHPFGEQQWLCEVELPPAITEEYYMMWYEGDRGGVIVHVCARKPQGGPFDQTWATHEKIYAGFAHAQQWRIVQTSEEIPVPRGKATSERRR